MEPSVEFCILGPLEVRTGGGEGLALGGLRQRALLAVLVLHAGDVVARDRLVDELWPEQPPVRAVHTLQVFVSRLRRALGPAAVRLVTRGPGYALELGADELDASRFERLYSQARAALASSRPQETLAVLKDAEALWRGAPLADFTYEPFAQAAIARLTELRVSCREERIEADLALGRHAAVVADVEALVREQPYRERPRGQLMLALYRCGRQADALELYRDGRRRMVEELGLEPGQALRELQEKILGQSADLNAPATADLGTEPAPELRDPAIVGRDTQGDLAGAMELPAGTVTLMFSDIEGSTRLVEDLREHYDVVVEQHRRIIRASIAAHGGREVGTQGDGFFVAFARAGDAVRAALAAQRRLTAERWPRGAAVRVRVGLHTGEPRVADGDYVGLDVHYAARICAAAHGGQVVVSEATERVLAGRPVEGVLLGDLGEHRLKDLTRPVRLYQLDAEGLTAEFPPLRALERPPIDDPDRWGAPTALFGREADVDALERLVLEQRCRLVTLVGPGGVGKTRLAIAVARRLAGAFSDGARFVPLASVGESRELAPAMARALAAPIREGESSQAAVLRVLADRELLLVLDNLEQLIEGAPLVGETLSACPRLVVLITSREPARLAAERLFPVRPLGVPEAADPTPAAELERYSAVAMFLDRARARDPDFCIDDANAAHVSEICRRLDGLPLALELAAARIGLLAPAELATRLDQALGVLVGGTRDAPDRQRTLRATIEWSYGLLRDAERRALARMAVFPAGAPVAVAERVTGASLDTLESLVARQLVVRQDDRLRMLETVRQYALERLAEEPNGDTVRLRLADWCGELARDKTPELRRASRIASLARLEAELPTVLAVLSWALNQRRWELLFELLAEFGDYWWLTNRWHDGRPWFDAALESATVASDLARARVLLGRGRLADLHCSYDPVRADYEASLRLFRDCGDADGIAACLAHLSFLEAWRARHQRAAALGDEAIRFARRTDDESLLAFVLALDAIGRPDYTQAAERAHIALAHLQAVGDLHGIAEVGVVVAYMAIAERRYEDALGWLDTALEAARVLGAPFAIFHIHTNQGLARLFLGHLDAAALAFREALAVSRDAGAEDVVDETLLGLADVEALQGDGDRAARLAGAALGLESAERAVGEDAVWAQLLDRLARARKARGPKKWDDAARGGRALTVHDAIDLGLAQGRFAPPTTETTASPQM